MLRWMIRFLFVVAVGYLVLLTVFANSSDGDAKARAIVGMAWGLFVLWVLVGGAVMLRWREPFRHRVLRQNGRWPVQFVLMATALALIEEAITTAMTNLAPLFGVKMGAVAITASGNYFEVVLFHSVIVFIPMFVAWAWLLSRYEFSALSVFFLFGITGTLSEWVAFGFGNPISFAFWLFVYGLMVYLPAYCVPAARTARPARLQHAALAVIFPLMCSVPVALVVMLVNQARQAV